MKPYLRYSEIDTLADDLRRHVRMCRDHESLYRLRDRTQIRIRRAAFHLRCIRINGKNFVSGIAQLPVNEIRWLTRIPRDASDCNPPCGKELSYLSRNL